MSRSHPSVLDLPADVLRARFIDLSHLLSSSAIETSGLGDATQSGRADELVWQMLEERGDILLAHSEDLRENFTYLVEGLG